MPRVPATLQRASYQFVLAVEFPADWPAGKVWRLVGEYWREFATNVMRVPVRTRLRSLGPSGRGLEPAAVVRLTRQAVARRCRLGLVPGAVRDHGSNRWLIPRTSLPRPPAAPAASETKAERLRRAQADLDWLRTVR